MGHTSGPDPAAEAVTNYLHVVGIILSGVGGTIAIIGWEGRNRYRILILLLGVLLIIAGVAVLLGLL